MTTVTTATPVAGTNPVAYTPTPNIADMILSVGIAAMEVNNTKIEAYYNGVEANNRQMQNYNNAMASVNAITSSNSSSTVEFDSNSPTFAYTDPTTGTTSTMSVMTFMQQNQLACPSTSGGKLDQTGLQNVLSSLKDGSDTLGNTNQIAMMQLQATINDANEMSQMVSDNMSKLDQMSMAIIGNMR